MITEEYKGKTTYILDVYRNNAQFIRKFLETRCGVTTRWRGNGNPNFCEVSFSDGKANHLFMFGSNYHFGIAGAGRKHMTSRVINKTSLYSTLLYLADCKVHELSTFNRFR